MGEFHLRTFTVTINRRNTHTAWGISIAGGCDQGSPLVITKVSLILFSARSQNPNCRRLSISETNSDLKNTLGWPLAHGLNLKIIRCTTRPGTDPTQRS
ncbi:hypothetical protein J6590_024632 [Homalodisca vitripennis]|nr:hypothetical protein J6590_024632 [Homalodisca vitripennis]